MTSSTKNSTVPEYSYRKEEGYDPHLVMRNGEHIWTIVDRAEWHDRDGKMHYEDDWGYATSSGGGLWWSEDNSSVGAPTKDNDWTYVPANEYMGKWVND